MLNNAERIWNAKTQFPTLHLINYCSSSLELGLSVPVGMTASKYSKA